ncbi:alpha/beta fold hydrolase [Rhizobium sp. SYY.PMSO]|uniref:alpha/beta fold hydrolase n=1 Tax=Rhizobium sp. SYY.PMSO TaxID=3382192 RepID=UPI00398FFA26
MNWVDERIEWEADGKPIKIGLTRFGTGPAILLLPGLSSISTRMEMWPLQERLGATFSTVAIDWPGFGDIARPMVDWRPDLHRAFLRFLLGGIVRPKVTIAAGHGAGYALAQAADDPASTGRLCLLSPTWRGPLPTMTGRRMALFRGLSKMVDLPVIGRGFYRLNVNGPVIGMMVRGHVYSDPAWLTPTRMATKRAVTEAPGVRFASFRFVAGELDPFRDRGDFLGAASRAGAILCFHGRKAPRKTKAEIEALGSLPNVTAIELPDGKLNFYEEFPDEAVAAINERLGPVEALIGKGAEHSPEKQTFS